ncbi:MAG: hypothetical protein DMF64_13740 [Acidobacteria bacterium]|nr:MAG: hypothetical protein DMF64_13740 [Acidobacteriota bacterium]
MRPSALRTLKRSSPEAFTGRLCQALGQAGATALRGGAGAGSAGGAGAATSFTANMGRFANAGCAERFGSASVGSAGVNSACASAAVAAGLAGATVAGRSCVVGD